METPSDPSPAQAGHGSASAAQEHQGRTKGPAMAAPPPPSVSTGFKGAEPLVSRDKDLGEDVGLERRDTAESFLSDFSYRRSNTSWSNAGSTATDLTDLNSPDVAFTEDAGDFEVGSYASSPRRSGLFPRPMPFQKRLPLRAPSVTCDTDKPRASLYGSSPDTPAARYRRLEQMASRKSSLSRYSSPTAPKPEPGLSAQGEPGPPGLPPPWIEASGEQAKRVGGQGPDNSERGRGVLSTPGPFISGSLEGTVVKAESGVDGADGCEQADDDTPTPGEATPEATGTSAYGVTPHERCDSVASDVTTTHDVGSKQPTAQPGDSMIFEICDQVLRQAFGVQLDEVALAGAMSAAYESVRYCLDELSHIVRDSGLDSTGIVFNESTRGGSGSSNVPIWPAGGSAGAAGTGGGGGTGGAGRKRSNGGHDGADSRGGSGSGSPGDGKRQKLSPTQQPSADMQYSCPFRKRNPLKFNVRDFQSCAVQSFPDMPQLKRHVKHFHKQTTVRPFTCQRCQRSMGTQEALEKHVSVGKDQICSPQKVASSADPEDGITSGIEDALNGRKADSKVNCWDTLWHLLFPGDSDIPESDFVPPTELDEVYAQFHADQYTHRLHQCIQEALGPASNVEGIYAVFDNHIESVFEACRLRTSGMASGNRRHRRQTSRQMTSRRSSEFLAPVHPTPRRQGSVRSDSSISSPVATPNSTNTQGNNPEQLLLAELQPQAAYAALKGAYYGSSAGSTRAGPSMMSLVPGGSPGGASQGSYPAAVPAAEHIHMGFGSPSKATGTPFGMQLEHHPGLLPADPRLALDTDFGHPQAGNFSTMTALNPQNGYQAMSFGQPVSGLSLPRSSPGLQGLQGMQGMHDQVFSPADQTMAPTINLYLGALAADGDEYQDCWSQQ